MSEARIATCCYCGTRAAFEMSHGGRHELVCTSCGAPLSKIEAAMKSSPSARAPQPDASPRDFDVAELAEAFLGGKSKKKKKSKSKKAVKGLFDFIEDIFD